MRVLRRYFLFFLCFTSSFLLKSFSQCTNPIIATPPFYEQNFDGSNNNWVAGGTKSTWQRGLPNKSIIRSTGQGSDCWITGYRNGTSYESFENSYIVSPCFNISAFQLPKVSFKIFVETETSYDGACFEYSLDGVNWKILGDENSNSNCLGTNWYNYNAVRFLDTTTNTSPYNSYPGWSQTSEVITTGQCKITGTGPGIWVQSSHSLNIIKGAGAVFFRFRFNSGLKCNDFNGFAIDQFRIEETPLQGPPVDFNIDCISANSFNFSTPGIPCQQFIEWDFGDGFTATNTNNPVHTYASSGSYPVTMKITLVNGQVSEKTKTVNVITSDISQTNPISCPGAADAALQVAVNDGGLGYSYSYAWTQLGQTTVLSNASAPSGLSAGSYVVKITPSNSAVCSFTDTFTITDPPEIVITPTVSDAVCVAENGQILLTLTGGTPPYSILWDDGSSGYNRSGLKKGNYSVTVTDGKGCTETFPNIFVDSITPKLPLYLGEDTIICVNEPLLLDAGFFDEYLWQDGSTFDTFRVTTTGLYYVKVTDNRGCEAADSILVTVDDCKGLLFPNAFSPNGDGLNDGFGPLGNLALVKRYYIKIFNRVGQLVFSSNLPAEKWDGKISGRDADPGVYAWTAAYYYNGKFFGFKKGSILLIR